MRVAKERIALCLFALLLVAPAARAALDKPLIKGLDGGDYERYKPEVIERAQQRLAELGLYGGPIDGKLTPEVMESLGQFQKEHDLAVTGIPTPRTREALQEATGSGEGLRPGNKQ